MNNRILRLASLQIAQDPNNIVKVAGILSRVKRWILSMFDSRMREQIGVIDSKYSELKGLIRVLQDNIVAIEKSIENVDVPGYDSNVLALSKTLSSLNEKISDAKKTIEDSQTNVLTKDLAPSSNPKFVEFFKNKKLGDLGVTARNVRLNESIFVNSLRGLNIETDQVLGRRPALALFGGDNEKLNEFIKAFSDEHILQKHIIPDLISNFNIYGVFEPKKKLTQSKAINACLLNIQGWSKVVVAGNPYEINVLFVLDVFLPSVDDLKESAKDGFYHSYKQYVNDVRLPTAATVEVPKISESLETSLEESEKIEAPVTSKPEIIMDSSDLPIPNIFGPQETKDKEESNEELEESTMKEAV